MKKLFLLTLLTIAVLTVGVLAGAEESKSISEYGIAGRYNSPYDEESYIFFTPYNEMGTQGAYLEKDQDELFEGDYRLVANKIKLEYENTSGSMEKKEYLIFDNYICSQCIFEDFPSGGSIDYKYTFDDSMYGEFKSDGTFSGKNGNINYTGTYTVYDNILIMTYNNEKTYFYEKYYNDNGNLYAIYYEKAEEKEEENSKS